jgi:hypothetical protein
MHPLIDNIPSITIGDTTLLSFAGTPSEDVQFFLRQFSSNCWPSSRSNARLQVQFIGQFLRGLARTWFLAHSDSISFDSLEEFKTEFGEYFGHCAALSNMKDSWSDLVFSSTDLASNYLAALHVRAHLAGVSDSDFIKKFLTKLDNRYLTHLYPLMSTLTTVSALRSALHNIEAFFTPMIASNESVRALWSSSHVGFVSSSRPAPSTGNEKTCYKCTKVFSSINPHCFICHDNGHSKFRCTNKPTTSPATTSSTSPAPAALSNFVSTVEPAFDVFSVKRTASQPPNKKFTFEREVPVEDFDPASFVENQMVTLPLKQLVRLSPSVAASLQSAISTAATSPTTRVAATTSLSVQSAPTSAFRVLGLVNNVETPIILDSGSDCSIVSRSFVSSIAYPLSSTSRLITSATGHKSSFVGFADALPFVIQSLSSTANCFVLDNAPFSILLGMDWMITNKVILDLENRVVRIGSMVVPLLASDGSSTSTTFFSRLSPDTPPIVSSPLGALWPRIAAPVSRLDGSVGITPLVLHSIDTGSSAPISCRSFIPIPAARLDRARALIQELLRDSRIRDSSSPWASRMLLVPKPDGSDRLVIDYRGLNPVTVSQPYCMPRADVIFNRLAGCSIFSVLDLKSGFWQVPMDPLSIPKTAFLTPFGRFEWLVMPFGLKNAPATFQALMDVVLRPVAGTFADCFIDDILVYSSDAASHLKHLSEVVDLLAHAGLTINNKKCIIGVDSVKYLGYIISSKGITADPAKVASIQDFPIPVDQTSLRRFLGLTNFYRSLVPNFSSLASPLNSLLTHSNSCVWSTIHDEAFRHLKSALCSASVLVHPIFSAPFRLETDASSSGLGAILSQSHGVIAYASRSLLPAEKNYSATDLECLAVVWAIKHFHNYLYGHMFEVVSDHRALLALRDKSDVAGRLARWACSLQYYDFRISHRPGVDSPNVDALSRAYFCSYLSSSAPPTTLSKLFVLKDGILFRVADGSLPARPVPDSSARSGIVLDVHLASGHSNWRSTYELVRSKYFWLGMRSDVQNWVKTCSICSSFNRFVAPSSLPALAHSGSPFSKVQLDLVGPLPITPRGNRFILCVIDCFTRYAITHAIPDKNEKTVAIALLETVLLKFGFPQTIQSDNGREFVNSVVDSLLDNLKIGHSLSTPYRPQSNGMVERFNQSLLLRLGKLAYAYAGAWDSLLNVACFAYNSAVHSALESVSPFELLFGYKPFLNDSSEELLGWFRKRFNVQVQSRKVKLLEGTTGTVQIGSLVWKRTKKVEKLAPSYTGPFVVEDVGFGSARIVDTISGLSHSCHESDLKIAE